MPEADMFHMFGLYSRNGKFLGVSDCGGKEREVKSEAGCRWNGSMHVYVLPAYLAAHTGKAITADI